MPSGDLAAAIKRDFGSVQNFQEEFNNAAGTVFGSGWAWLVSDSGGNLSVMQTRNQDCPLTEGYKPVLCIDVWEHAYYLRYQSRRGDYIKSFWNVVNWDKAAANYAAE